MSIKHMLTIILISLAIGTTLCYVLIEFYFKETTRKVIPLEIWEITTNSSRFVGYEVYVKGYFGHHSRFGYYNYSFLITDYTYLLMNKPPPKGSWIRLTGKIPPKNASGLLVVVHGKINIINDEFADNVPLLTVDSYKFITKKAVYSLSNTRKLTSIAHHLGILSVTQRKKNDYIVIICGIPNKSIFKEEVISFYTLCKELGFDDDHIILLYGDKKRGDKLEIGWIFKDIAIVDNSAEKVKVKRAFEDLLRKVKAGSSLIIFVTNHGIGFDKKDPNRWKASYWTLYKIGENTDPGLSYSENLLKIDMHDDQYVMGYRILLHPSKPWIIVRYPERNKIILYRQEHNTLNKVWVGVGDRVSESEVGIDLNGDHDKNDVFSCPINVHRSLELDTNKDGTVDLRVRWEVNRYIVERLIGGRWVKIGEDTNKDLIINFGSEVDWNNDGAPLAKLTFHEGICLHRPEILWDDELAKILKEFHNRGVRIRVVIGSCFGDGVCINLKKIAEVTAAASQEDMPAWINPGIIWDESYLTDFIDALEDEGKLDKDAWKRAHDSCEKDNYDPHNYGTIPVFREKPSFPDLTITSLKITPSRPRIGEHVKFTIILTNVGKIKVKDSDLRLRLILDSVESYKVSGISLRDGWLDPNDEVEIEIRWRFRRPGKFTIKVIADPKNKIKELFEDNNEKTLEVEVGRGADLNISKVTVLPKTIYEGTTATIKVVVKNIGELKAENFKVRVTVNGQLKESSPLFLNPNEEKELEFKFTFKKTGKYYANITVDPEDVVIENSESNNNKTLEIVVRKKLEIDIKIKEIEWIPKTIKLNTVAVFNITIEYTGVETITDFKVSMFVDEIKVNSTTLTLQPGITIVNFTYKFSSLGVHTVEFFVDSSFKVDEVNEENNRALIQLEVLGAPDLVIVGIEVPKTVKVGELISINITVLNNGTEKADSVVVALMIGETSRMSGIFPLEPGATMTVNFFIKFEEEGRYVIIAIADPEGIIEELNEENNYYESQVVVSSP